MNESTPEDQGNSGDSQYLYCPHCGGGNLLDAIRCRWCRKSLDTSADSEPDVQPEAQPVPQVPLDQVYCLHCKGGNPPDAVHCMWCKRPLDLDAAAAELAPSRNLFESYNRAVFAPSLLRYAAEVPHASWRRIWISLAVAAVASSLVTVIENLELVSDITETITGALGAAIGIVVSFFIQALSLYGIAKLFGGKGRAGSFRLDFLVHAYLVVLCFTPFSIAADVLLTLPGVGIYFSFILSLYQLYLFYLVVQVSRQLDSSSAVATVITFVIAGVFLILCVVAIALGLYMSQLTNIFSEIGSGLGP